MRRSSSSMSGVVEREDCEIVDALRMSIYDGEKNLVFGKFGGDAVS